MAPERIVHIRDVLVRSKKAAFACTNRQAEKIVEEPTLHEFLAGALNSRQDGVVFALHMACPSGVTPDQLQVALSRKLKDASPPIELAEGNFQQTGRTVSEGTYYATYALKEDSVVLFVRAIGELGFVALADKLTTRSGANTVPFDYITWLCALRASPVDWSTWLEDGSPKRVSAKVKASVADALSLFQRDCNVPSETDAIEYKESVNGTKPSDVVYKISPILLRLLRASVAPGAKRKVLVGIGIDNDMNETPINGIRRASGNKVSSAEGMSEFAGEVEEKLERVLGGVWPPLPTHETTPWIQVCVIPTLDYTGCIVLCDAQVPPTAAAPSLNAAIALSTYHWELDSEAKLVHVQNVGVWAHARTYWSRSLVDSVASDVFLKAASSSKIAKSLELCPDLVITKKNRNFSIADLASNLAHWTLFTSSADHLKSIIGWLEDDDDDDDDECGAEQLDDDNELGETSVYSGMLRVVIAWNDFQQLRDCLDVTASSPHLYLVAAPWLPFLPSRCTDKDLTDDWKAKLLPHTELQPLEGANNSGALDELRLWVEGRRPIPSSLVPLAPHWSQHSKLAKRVTKKLSSGTFSLIVACQQFRKSGGSSLLHIVSRVIQRAGHRVAMASSEKTVLGALELTLASPLLVVCDFNAPHRLIDRLHGHQLSGRQQPLVVLVTTRIAYFPYDISLMDVDPFIPQNQIDNVVKSFTLLYPGSREALRTVAAKASTSGSYSTHRHLFQFVLAATKNSSLSVRDWVHEEWKKVDYEAGDQDVLKLLAAWSFFLTSDLSEDKLRVLFRHYDDRTALTRQPLWKLTVPGSLLQRTRVRIGRSPVGMIGFWHPLIAQEVLRLGGFDITCVRGLHAALEFMFNRSGPFSKPCELMAQLWSDDDSRQRLLDLFSTAWGTGADKGALGVEIFSKFLSLAEEHCDERFCIQIRVQLGKLARCTEHLPDSTLTSALQLAEEAVHKCEGDDDLRNMCESNMAEILMKLGKLKRAEGLFKRLYESTGGSRYASRMVEVLKDQLDKLPNTTNVNKAKQDLEQRIYQWEQKSCDVPKYADKNLSRSSILTG